jgi:phosphate transport system substrate-binding protein
MRGAVVIGVLLAAAAGGRREPGPSTRHVVVTGSFAMAPLVREIADRFQTQHPGVRVDVQPDDSDHGVRDAQQGLADVGMVGRPLRADETGVRALVLARDGLAVVVNRANPVKALSEAGVVGLFTRNTATWKPLGGPDVPVTVVALPDNRSLAQSFLDHFNLKSGQVRADVKAADTAAMLRVVAEKPEAVGYAALGMAAASDLPVRLLPCAGVAATPENVANGTYPLTRPLLLVTRDPPTGMAQPFVEFARSAAVRDLLDKYHVLPPAEGQ